MVKILVLRIFLSLGIYVKSYEIFTHFEYNSMIVAPKKSPPRQNSKFIFPYVSLTNKEKYHFFSFCSYTLAIFLSMVD